MKWGLALIWMATNAFAGKHLMNDDILPGGATSYVQNGTSAQTSTFNLQDSLLGTTGTIAQSKTSGLTTQSVSLSHTCAVGVIDGNGISITQSGGCLSTSNSILITNSATTPVNTGISSQLDGASTTRTIAMNASASGTSSENFGFRATASNATHNFGLWTSASGGTSYGIFVNAGQIHAASSMTVTGPVSVSSITITSGGFLGLGTRTLAQLAALIPVRTYQTYGCSDCTANPVCISTQTVTASWASISAKQTACN